jgi:hypothetical protein
MRYRRGAVFVRDPLEHGRALDRNERARLMLLAETWERRSKRAGCRNGDLGYVGLAVLKCLLWGFLGAKGLCCPSYDRIQHHTGLCRQSIARGIRRLEETGFIRVVRRIVRERVGHMIVTRQASNLYAFAMPSLPDGAYPLPRLQLRGFQIEQQSNVVPYRGDVGALTGAVLDRYRKANPHDWRETARKAMQLASSRVRDRNF